MIASCVGMKYPNIKKYTLVLASKTSAMDIHLYD